MKRVILLSLSILLISSGFVFAEVPCKINYQGRLIKDNVPVDGTKTTRFSIYDSAAGGTQLWTSGDVSVEVHNGLFRYVIGSGGTDLSGIDWTAGQALYLQVMVEGETLTPREELSAYPYAINSHLLEGETKEYFINTSAETQTKQGDLNIMGNLGIGTTGPTHKLDVRGPIRIISSASAGYDIWIQGGIAGTGDDRNLALLGADEGHGDRLYLNYGGEYAGGTIIGGNVGIGTTNPGAKLEVNGNIVANPTYSVVERATSWTTASKTWVDIPNFTATITTHGKPVMITANINYNPVESEGSSGHSAACFTIFRDGINLGDSVRGLQVGTAYYLSNNENVSMVYIDTPAAGTHNYTVGVKAVWDTVQVCELGEKIQLAVVELN